MQKVSDPDAVARTKETARSPSPATLRGLDWLNFLLADVQTGVGPFLAIYLAGYKWNEQRVGLTLTVGGLAGLLAQTPAGGLVDYLRSKRALVAAAVIALAMGALAIALFPTLWTVMGSQVLIGAMSSVFIPAICAMSRGVVGAAAFGRERSRRGVDGPPRLFHLQPKHFLFRRGDGNPHHLGPALDQPRGD